MAERQRELAVGSRVGPYVVDRTLGAGGFGITYLATGVADETGNDRVVIKEFFPGDFVHRSGSEVVTNSNVVQEDFIRLVLSFVSEGLKLKDKLAHENIVSVLDIITCNSTAYLVMDYIDGPTLGAWSKSDDFQFADAVEVLAQTIDAIEYLHWQNELHRDVSPSNIMIDRRTGAVVLIDFGASAEGIEGERSESSIVVANSQFAPPEQLALDGRRIQGPFTDIFSIAATFYKIFTGSPPISAMGRWLAIVERGEDPYVPVLRGLRFPRADLGGIDLSALDDALRLAPAMRPQSAAEFRSMLGLRSPRADRIRLRLEQGLETTMTDAAGLGEPTTEVLFPERRC